MKKFLLSLIVISSLLFTGCPKAEKTYRTAKEASANIQFHTLKLIEANIAGYKSGELSLQRKDSIAVLTGNLQKGIEIYRKALKEVEPYLKGNKPLPGDTLSKLQTIFKKEVVDKVAAITEELRLMSPEQSALFRTTMAAIDLAIVSIYSSFAEAENLQRSVPSWA